ncbi:tetratricopeptide repeat protein [Brachyspira aalborgi]|uniref:Tetratricopeptide repeat protein n=2 Tax=Brachyspira aalborgi TaxID=29522 RepID=A0A5C8GFP8_9SPIR|nr:tetratricopeptide repeat protein [Brachyspira aalborgi]TXJ37789.1 tetratricopeptide repeat protein [Brachyspira aalborgi]TXJ60722.1 tetratricopeptide repeat protein [Brachyspira aalborgi]
MAAILIEKGIYNEAISDLNNVIKINNNNAGAYYNLGVIYSYQEKYQLAIDNFNRCINLSEGNNYFQKISYYNLGIIVGIMGNNEEAVSNLIKAYEIEDNMILKTIKEEAEIYNNKVVIDYLAKSNIRINY